MEIIEVIDGKNMMFTGKCILDGGEVFLMRDDFEFVTKYATILIKVHTKCFCTVAKT